MLPPLEAQWDFIMTSLPKIGIILGTTRPARFSHRPGEWIADLAATRGDAAFEIVDLLDYKLPFFAEDLVPAQAQSSDPEARRWLDKVSGLDGYLFVTAEYNHGIPAVLKNALDTGFGEFRRKPAAFISYGAVGGARAVEQLRLVLVELQVAPLRSALHIGATEFVGVLQGKSFEDFPHLGGAARALLDELVWWTLALKTARAA